jgi:hypothetical protein
MFKFLIVSFTSPLGHLPLVGRYIVPALIWFFHQLPLTINLFEFLILFLLSPIYIVVDIFQFSSCKYYRVLHHLLFLHLFLCTLLYLRTPQSLLFLLQLRQLFHDPLVQFWWRIPIVKFLVLLSNRLHSLLEMLKFCLQLLKLVRKTLYQSLVLILWLWLKCCVRVC